MTPELDDVAYATHLFELFAEILFLLVDGFVIDIIDPRVQFSISSAKRGTSESNTGLSIPCGIDSPV